MTTIRIGLWSFGFRGDGQPASPILTFINLTLLFGAIDKFKLRNTSVRGIIYFLGCNVCFCDNNRNWSVDLWIHRWWKYLWATCFPILKFVNITFLFGAINKFKLCKTSVRGIIYLLGFNFCFFDNDRNWSVEFWIHRWWKYLWATSFPILTFINITFLFGAIDKFKLRNTSVNSIIYF